MKIAFLDSGVGGLTILASTLKNLPLHDYTYLADTKNFPYSEKSESELNTILAKHVKSLVDGGIQLIVLACNTATVTSLKNLRKKFPETIFVGTVPPLAVAANQTPTGSKILVLATKNTAHSLYLANLIKAFPSHNFEVVGSTYLVKNIEKGDSKAIEKELQVIKEGVGEIGGIVFGCTHFPYMESEINEVFGSVKTFSSTGGVVKRIKHLVKSHPKSKPHIKFENYSGPHNLQSWLTKAFKLRAE